MKKVWSTTLPITILAVEIRKLGLIGLKLAVTVADFLTVIANGSKPINRVSSSTQLWRLKKALNWLIRKQKRLLYNSATPKIPFYMCHVVAGPALARWTSLFDIWPCVLRKIGPINWSTLKRCRRKSLANLSSCELGDRGGNFLTFDVEKSNCCWTYW